MTAGILEAFRRHREVRAVTSATPVKKLEPAAVVVRLYSRESVVACMHGVAAVRCDACGRHHCAHAGVLAHSCAHADTGVAR